VKSVYCSEWKTLFDILKDVANDFPLEFVKPNEKEKVEGGIRIMALDSHLSALVFVKLDISGFLDFDIEQTISNIDIEVGQLHKFLKTIDNVGTVLTIEILKEDRQNILFQAENKEKGTLSQFKLKIMDNENEKTPQIPDQKDHDFLVIMNTSEFHKICREFVGFDENIEIQCTKNTIIFSCKSSSSAFVKNFSNGINGTTIRIGNKRSDDLIYEGIFQLKQLNIFTKCANLSDDVKLYFKNNRPLFMQYKVSDHGSMLVAITHVQKDKIMNAESDKNKNFFGNEDSDEEQKTDSDDNSDNED